MAAISVWKRGDYVSIARVTITDASGPVDLTDGYTITWQLRQTPNAGSFVPVDVDLSDAGSGVLLGSLDSEVTVGMAPGIWYSDIEVVKEDGKPFSSTTFEFEVLPDVSRPIAVVAP